MTEPRLFEGRVALVTGATSGIGRAVALRLARDGALVAGVGRRSNQDTAIALPLTADVTVEAEVERVVRETVERFGRLDILINGAGRLLPGTIEDTPLAAWDAVLNLNLRAAFHMMQLATPHLIATRGNVVNISSVVGLRQFRGLLAYSVSKAALDQLTRCAALELAEKGVRVNAVNPGVVKTDIHVTGGLTEEEYVRFLERSKTTHPLGRTGEPEEIADLIAFLASDQARWITGVTYSIDGGRALTCAR